MRKKKNKYIIVILSILLMMSCSTKRNTSQSRWWHAFNARYNTYFNGAQAYIDGSLEKEKGNKDNFTELLPLYTVGNKNSREIGKANFDKAIEKAEKAIAQHSIKRKPEWNKNRRKTDRDIEWLSRREYNPFLWKAWMLMGRSQFHQGAFEEAAATFAYMSRIYKGQPAIYGKARAWLAKCYIEQNWLYDAEDIIRNMQRDSIDWRAVKEWDYAYTDYYLHTGELDKAIPYLQKVIKHELRKQQKARELYLLGQIYAAIGRNQEAYKTFQCVLRTNPPYELEFNARIAQTEVLAQGQSKKMIGKLRRMAASDNNKEYLDQVYYAMGNIYLSDKDTLSAIKAYEEGNKKATRSGIEKGVLLLHLGDLYWTQEKFSDAKRCYGEAIGMLDKDRKEYDQLSQRSKILDELVPFTDAIHFQDSLQYLAKASESERNAAIDKVIEAFKKKEKENRRLENQQENQSPEGIDLAFSGNNIATISRINSSNRQAGGSTWYFYNPTAVQQGKITFQQLWGKRENTDNWQRSNQTVVGNIGSNSPTDELTDAQRDSILNAEAKADAMRETADSLKNDPHQREYYLSQIPFTKEQLEESNKIIEDGLYHAGVIFKDKLNNLVLAEKSLKRLETDYPKYEKMDDAYYHLYLLYMQKREPLKAQNYVNYLKDNFPESQWTALLTNPFYERNLKYGVQIEDSLYTSTYNAFKEGRYQEVKKNTEVSEERFPMGANREKFLFIGGLSKLNEGDIKGTLQDMQTVIEKYSNSRLSELAGMIINGVKAGRQLRGGHFDLDDVWTYRSNMLNDSDSIQHAKLSPDRNITFKYLLVYNPDSIKENKLLFELAKFNFTNFLVRNFEIAIDDIGGVHQMVVSGFRNYDEAYQYAQEVYSSPLIVQQLNKQTKAIIISVKNLQLIGSAFSFKDYQEFYSKNFAPLGTTNRNLLNEPIEITKPQERDLEQEIENKYKDNQDFYPLNEVSAPSSVTTFPLDEPTPQTQQSQENKQTVQQQSKNSAPSTKQVDTKKTSDGTTTPPKVQPIPQQKKVEQPTQTNKKPIDDGPIIYFGNGEPQRARTNNKKQQPLNNKIEDEYYDLDGF